MAKKEKLSNKKDNWEGTSGPDKVDGLGGNDTFDGKGGDDKIWGGDGNDTINGGSGDDKLIGGAGNDTMNGGSGDDRITANNGDDTVDGGSGNDLAILSGNRADATVTENADGSYTIVTAAGTVTISNVETVRFADGDVAVDDLIPPVGVTKDLTTGTDTITDLTAQNDTITGAAGTVQATDIIIDNSSTDADVMNLTLNAANGAAKISGIETINVNWDSFAAASFVATNVTGANINLTSSKLGFLGAATVTNAGANTVTAGSGMTGALTVDGITGATINATNSSSVTADGSAAATDSVKVNGGASTTNITVGNATAIETVTVAAGAATTTISVKNYDTATIDAGTATTVNLTDDAATDSATVKIGADAAVTLTGTGKLAIEVADGKTATVSNIGADLTVSGTGSVTVSSGDIDKNTVKDSVTGTFTLVSTAAGAVDFSKADADLFVLATAGATGGTFVSGDAVRADVDLVAGAFTVGGAGTTDSLTATFTKDQTSTTFTAVETANVVAAATAVAGKDITFSDLINAGNTINLSGTNDVVITKVDTKTLDASALVGDLTVTSDTTTNITIAGASGVNKVTFESNTPTTASFIGQGGADVVDFQTLAATGSFTAVTGAGNDTVKATIGGLGAGSLSVEGGEGNDTVELTGTLGGTSTVVLQGGNGTDTLSLADTANLSGTVNLTVTGFEAIKLAGDATVNASLLSGQSYTVTGIGSGTSDLTVEGTTAADTINLSNLVATDSITTGVSFVINGGTGNDSITGSITNDKISGGVGADVMAGGTGLDDFVFAAGVTDTVATANSIAGVDKITDAVFNAGAADQLDLTVVVANVNTAVSGSVSEATFVADMNSLLAVGGGAGFNSAVAGDISAAVVNVNAGGLSGRSFLVVDLDNSDTFTATDFVVEITGSTVTSLTAADFI